MTKPCPWITAIDRAADAFCLRVLFHEVIELIENSDIHNALFERIYFLENRTTDKDELTSLSWLKYDLELEVEAFFKEEKRLFNPREFIGLNILKFLKPFEGVEHGKAKQ